MDRSLEGGGDHATRVIENTRGRALAVGRHGKLDFWDASTADITSWSAMLSNEARRLEMHGMEVDHDSIVLLRQLASQVNQIKEHLDAKDEQLRALRGKLTDQRRAREALDVLGQHVEKLEERCQSRDEETAALRRKVRDQSALLERSASSKSALRQRVVAREAAAAEAEHLLRQQMGEMEGHVAALQEDAAKREELRRRLEAELDAAAEREASNQEKQEELSATVDSLKSQLAESTAKLERQAEQLRGKALEVSDARMELARVGERLRGATEDRETQRVRFEEKEAEWEAVIRQADDRLVEADATILDLRRTVASLDGELERAREAADVAECQVAERERSAEAQAGAVSHLEENLRRTECELADLQEEHSRRAAPQVETEFVAEIERLERQLETARKEARGAIGDATEAAAARDAAERRLLHVIAQVADEASDLRHLLSQAATDQAHTNEPPLQRGLLGNVPDQPLPEPAGMALSTLAVTARKAVTALRETREREKELQQEVEEARQTLDQVDRERVVSTAAAADLRRLLEKAQDELQRRTSDGETERTEAHVAHEALLARCSQLERQQRSLVEAVAAACVILQGLEVPEDLRPGGVGENGGFKRPESLTGLQVSLAEQTEAAAASHAALVRIARHLRSDNAELSESRDEIEHALDKASNQEAQLRLRLQSSEEALSRAKASLQKGKESHREELRGLSKQWAGRISEEAARAAEEREAVAKELDSSRATAHKLLTTVQLLVRYAAPVRQKLADVRWAKAFLSAQLRASILQAQEMQTALAGVQERLLGAACARGREGARIAGSDRSGTVWEEKGVTSLKGGVSGRVAGNVGFKGRFKAGVWAVLAHLRLLALGSFSVNQTVTKVCREIVPLLPRGSVRLEDGLMLAVAEAGGESAREEAEAVVKLLDTAQKNSRLGPAPLLPQRLPRLAGGSADSFRTLVERITSCVEDERAEQNNLMKALQNAGAIHAKEHAAARLWETEARKYGELISYMEERERQLQAALNRSVPLDEHQRIVDELRRIKGEAEGIARERVEVDRELTSQIKVASRLRTQLLDARKVVHGKDLATDRLGLELQKEREQLRRLRESAALQEAHHRRLQEDYTALVDNLCEAESAVTAAKRDVDERADVARRMGRKADAARDGVSLDGLSDRQARKAVDAAHSEAAAARQEALLSQQRLRKQSAVCDELTSQSHEMQRQLQASREHASVLRQELQSAIEREVSERDDRAQWVRARNELQAVRSAAEERLAALVHTGAPQEDGTGGKLLPRESSLVALAGPVDTDLGGEISAGEKRRTGKRMDGSLVESRGVGSVLRSRVGEKKGETEVGERRDGVRRSSGGHSHRKSGDEQAEGGARQVARNKPEPVSREYAHAGAATEERGSELRNHELRTGRRSKEVESVRTSSRSVEDRVQRNGFFPSEEGRESLVNGVRDWLRRGEVAQTDPIDPAVELEKRLGHERRNAGIELEEVRKRKGSAATDSRLLSKDRTATGHTPSVGPSGRLRSTSAGDEKRETVLRGVSNPSVKDMIGELRKLASTKSSK